MGRTYTYKKLDKVTVEITETEPERVRVFKKDKAELDRQIEDAEGTAAELKKARATLDT